MSDKPNEIGERIKKRRKEAGLSLSQLADDAGVSKSYLSRLESGAGEMRPSGKTLYLIARALGTTMSDLLEREVLADAPSDFSPSLVQFAKKEGLTPREQRMLAQINFRGRHPESVDDWEFLWTAIQRSVPARPARKSRSQTLDRSAQKK
jgi:XRE family transcriptional regulator of biofilm formation